MTSCGWVASESGTMVSNTCCEGVQANTALNGVTVDDLAMFAHKALELFHPRGIISQPGQCQVNILDRKSVV